MDLDNPAVLAQTGLSPAMLEDIAKDPKALTGPMRKLLFVTIDNIHMLMKDPKVPMTQRLAYAELLAKLGDAIPKQAALGAGAGAGPGFSVEIVFNSPRPGASFPAPKAEVVDVLASEVKSDE